jgi:hypothetical protein
MIFRPYFYETIRAALFGPKLTSGQTDGYERLLNQAELLGLGDRELAYILATAFHETAQTMQPIEEYGKGKGKPYGKPAGVYNKIYYGRGYVQLTWLQNYETMDAKLQMRGELVQQPELACDPDIAAQIIMVGMRDGCFTGVGLHQFIDDRRTDFYNARKIVNALDRAADIQEYAVKHANAIVHSG